LLVLTDAVPAVVNSLEDFAAGNVLAVVERVLKISVTNALVFLAGFFALFDVHLALLADITGTFRGLFVFQLG
jgi:hypothetical protein